MQVTNVLDAPDEVFAEIERVELESRMGDAR